MKNNTKEKFISLLESVKNDETNYRKIFLTKNEWRQKLFEKIFKIKEILEFDTDHEFVKEDYITNELNLLKHDIADLIDNALDKIGPYNQDNVQYFVEKVNELEQLCDKLDLNENIITLDQILDVIDEFKQLLVKFIDCFVEFVPLEIKTKIDLSTYIVKGCFTSLMSIVEKSFNSRGK